MSPGKVVLAAAALVAVCSAALPARAQLDSPDGSLRPVIALESVALVDVVRGEIVSPRTVLIVDGRITELGPPEAVAVPPKAVRVEGRGRYLLPGLVDMHVHLFNNSSRRAPNEWTFPLFVANGVTGIREMLTEPAQMVVVNGWRAKVSRGELIAPRVLAAGVAAGFGTVEAAQQQVRAARAAGADFVKIFSEVPEPQWRAILEEARTLSIPVCGHVPGAVSALDAATAGQRSNEHLTQIYEASSAKEQQWLGARRGKDGAEIVQLRDAQEPEVLAGFDPAICDRLATALANTKQVQVPTLVLAHFESRGSPKNARDDPRWRYLRPDEQERWQRLFKAIYPAEGDKLAARRWEVSRQIVGSLQKAGVRILAGTDAPMPLVYPGFSLHQELALLVESGLSPADALRAATLWPAEFLGISADTGAIAVGKRADLLLLDEDPLSDIRNTQRIRAVVLDGRLLQRADLDALLAGAAASAAK